VIVQELALASLSFTLSAMLTAYAPIVVAVHVAANAVWIGSIMCVGTLIGRARLAADCSEVGALALRLYRIYAMPAFIISFLAGAARIGMTPRAYTHELWLHVKLGFALFVIVLHHVIGARAKRLAQGDRDAASGGGVLAFTVFVCATATVGLAVTKMLP
jgi:putative membrane protein